LSGKGKFLPVRDEDAFTCPGRRSTYLSVKKKHIPVWEEEALSCLDDAFDLVHDKTGPTVGLLVMHSTKHQQPH